VAAILSGSPQAHEQRRAFLSYPASSGVRWTSVEQFGPVDLGGQGTYWMAFRAFATGGPHSVRLQGADATRFVVPIGARPAIHFVGPIVLQGASTYWLNAAPAHTPAGQVLVSEFRLVRGRLAALPGAGFWPTDFDPGSDTYANWLNSIGSVDVASGDPATRSAMVSFDASSIDHPRTVTVSGGGRRATLRIPQKGSSRHFALGPFRLVDGRVRLRFVSPGPAVYGSDPRRRSILVDSLAASPVP
jgi:hypothetical protein